MLFLFHGSNASASLTAAQNFLNGCLVKSPTAELIRLDGEKITKTGLIEAIEAPSIFSESRIVYVENLLSRRQSKEKDELLAYLAKNAATSTIVDWESKAATPATLKKIVGKDTRVQEFKIAKSLFKFLDSFRPGNHAATHALFQATLKTDAAELVFYLLVKRLNQLFIAKSGDMEVLKKELRQDWQIRNLMNQASAWTEDQLAATNRRLLEIDESIKTGSSPIDLALQLDIFFLTL